MIPSTAKAPTTKSKMPTYLKLHSSLRLVIQTSKFNPSPPLHHRLLTTLLHLLFSASIALNSLLIYCCKSLRITCSLRSLSSHSLNLTCSLMYSGSRRSFSSLSFSASTPSEYLLLPVFAENHDNAPVSPRAWGEQRVCCVRSVGGCTLLLSPSLDRLVVCDLRVLVRV